MRNSENFLVTVIGTASCSGSFNRDVRRLLDRVIIARLVDIVVADHVGDEDAVEKSTLERNREIGPIFDVLVLPGAIARIGPQARRLVPDAVHLEGVKSNPLVIRASLSMRRMLQSAADSVRLCRSRRPGCVRESPPSGTRRAATPDFMAKSGEFGREARRSSWRVRNSRGMSITCLMRPGREVMTATR